MKTFVKEQLLDPKLSDEDISFILYEGKWSNLFYLKQNSKIKEQPEDFWNFIAKDKELFWSPWYPIGFFLLIMGINLLFNFYEQFYSLLIATFGLVYVSLGIPVLYSLKEKKRIEFLDQYLDKSPYHRDRFSN